MYIVVSNIVVVVPPPQVKIGGYCVGKGGDAPTSVTLLWARAPPQTKLVVRLDYKSSRMASNCVSQRMSFQVSEDAKVLIIQSIHFGSFLSESCILLIAFTNKLRMVFI